MLKHRSLFTLASLEAARRGANCLEDTAGVSTTCAIEFRFHDRNGRAVQQSAATLVPGGAAQLDFRITEPVQLGRRSEIIPCIRVVSGVVSASLQVFDGFPTRRRILTNPNDRAAALAGEIHFGLAWLTGTNMARVNAFCPVSPIAGIALPCDVELRFHDAQGRTLKRFSVTLLPATAGFLDFRTAEAGTPARRGDLIPCIRALRGRVIGALEVFDTATGLAIGFVNAASANDP